MSVYSSIYYSDSCNNSTPGFSCDPCGPREKARVRSAAFIKNTAAFTDYSNPTQWLNAVNNNLAYLLPNISGKVTAEPVIEKGYGDIEDQIVGYKYKAELEEPNYAANALFWNAMKNNRNMKLAYRTESKIHVSDVRVSIKPKANVEDDLNKNVVWSIEVTWNQEDLVLPHDTPPGIFDTCFSPV